MSTYWWQTFYTDNNRSDPAVFHRSTPDRDCPVAGKESLMEVERSSWKLLAPRISGGLVLSATSACRLMSVHHRVCSAALLFFLVHHALHLRGSPAPNRKDLPVILLRAEEAVVTTFLSLSPR